MRPRVSEMYLKHLFCLFVWLQSCSGSCQSSLNTLWDNSQYNTKNKQFSFSNVSNSTLKDCSKSGWSEGPDTELVLELVHNESPSELGGAGDQCCTKPCDTIRVQDQVYLRNLVSTPTFTFNYVEGSYFLRLRHCSSCAEGFCFRCKTLHCTDENQFGRGDILEVDQTCGNASLSYLSKLTKYSRTEVGLEDENCTLEVTAVFPPCSPVLDYSRANVAIVQVSSSYLPL